MCRYRGRPGCRQHGSTTTRGLEGLLSDERGALHALKSNRGEKALRILERSAALTESFAAQVLFRVDLAFAQSNKHRTF
jgi:hypothetical protein